MAINYDEKSCGIVVFRRMTDQAKGDHEYLLLHYPSGHWDFPKGHVEEGENENETAARELQEETGIPSIRFVDDFREVILYSYKKNGKPSRKLVIFFLGETRSQNVSLSHEHEDFIWLPYKEAFAKVTFDNAKNLLKKAEKSIQQE